MTLPKYLKHPLVIPLLIGLLLRIFFLAVSNHIYYPDELFQSVEQAFRLVNGYGIVPWDFAYGLRSYLLPLLIAFPLEIAKLIGITDPAIYRFFPQLFLIILSLSPIIASYCLVQKFSDNKHAATFAAYFTAIWYELIYFSGRAYTETISLYFFSFAVMSLHGKNPKHILGACFLLGATLLRPQLLLAGFFVGYYTLKKLHHLKNFILGMVITLVIFGLIDVIFMHDFLVSIQNNYRISYESGISELFGAKVWWYYLAGFTATSSGLWLFSLLPLTFKKNSVLWYALTSTVMLHTLIPHKEYRFTLIVIPLWIILFSLNFQHLITQLSQKRQRQLRRVALSIISLISIAGAINKIPFQTIAYGQPLLFNDPNIAVYNRLFHEQNICGIYDASRNWVYTPGYTALGRHVPLYSADYPPPNPDAISHYIIPTTNQQFAGFNIMFSTASYTTSLKGKPITLPGYTVYKKIIGPCIPDPNYTTYRSFPDVEKVLNSLNVKQYISQ